jgi:predicted ATPase/DNA-binding SARP family transcriptional activator
MRRSFLERLHLSLFGSFDAYLDGKSIVDFESAKVRALLTYLVVESDKGHQRQKLAGLFWPDWPEQSARTNLRNALSNLRKSIRDTDNPVPHLFIEHDQLRFNTNSSAWVDVLEFNWLTTKTDVIPLADLEKAAGLQLRPFLDGFSLSGCPEFESWALITQQILQQRLLTTLSHLSRQYELRCELQRAIEVTRRQTILEPFDEPLQRNLLRLLALNGERNLAIEQYEIFRKELRVELGIEPENETIRMVEHIRTGKLVHVNDRSSNVNNMPGYLTQFFGRQTEIDFIGMKLRDERLVTLTGSGGVGKTRLALKVAEATRNGFPDGIWFITLAALTDPDLVPQHIAHQLGINEEVQENAMDMVSKYLHSRISLLVIDNCEHLLTKIAWSVEILLTTCPKLIILTTSRQPLGLFGEIIIRVPSLPFPPQEKELSIQEMDGFASIKLFVDRARHVKPDFQLNDHNKTWVIRICRRLDGIPLAIELAAVHLNILSVDELASRLDHVFNLLTTGNQTAIKRHQTLRAAIDWSYRLLGEKEAKLLRRLAVFAGDWNLAGAEGVCAGEEIEATEIIDLLSGLVDKSMVDVIPIQGRPTRYRMLEVIRQYAQEELLKSAESSHIQRQHLAFYLQMVEENKPNGHDLWDWQFTMEAELENFRKALAFALESDPRSGLLLDIGLLYFWDRMEYLNEGIRWLVAFLRKPENLRRDTLRAQSLIELAFIATLEPNSQRWALESLGIFRELNDISGQAGAYLMWGLCLIRHEDFSGARQPLEMAKEIYEELNDLPRIAAATGLLSYTYEHTGPVSKSIRLMEKTMALYRNADDINGICKTCEVYAEILMVAGNLKQAKLKIEEADHILCQIEPMGYRQGIAYANAEINCWLGDYDAVRLFLTGVLNRLCRARSEDAIADYKFCQGYFLCLLGQAQEGLDLLQEGFQIFKTSRSFRYLINYKQTFLKEMFRALCSLGYINRARQLIDEYRHLYQIDFYHPGLYDLLGFLFFQEGQASIAYEHYLQSLKIACKMEFRLQALLALEGCSWVLAANGQAFHSASLLGAAAQFRDDSGAVVFPRDRPIHEQIIIGLKSTLGEKQYDIAWGDGYKVGFNQKISDLLERGSIFT